jgi:protocatechuate 3,4-dioxygenase beta subunit
VTSLKSDRLHIIQRSGAREAEHLTSAGAERRQLLTFGALLGASRALVACSATSTPRTAVDGGATDAAGGAAATGAGGSATVVGSDAAAADAGAWATGGTAAMIDKASYPNPFTTNADSTCAVTCELTEGPCYSSQSVEIQDISYGYAGLPLRLYFQVLDESCKPVSGATVDVWHVSPVGKYSGDDAANEDVAFCTGNDSDFMSHLYFRGKQTTDANGIVFFDTCFPGWYASRTIHIHLTISVGGKANVTTQFGFEDALDDEIVKTQPAYDTRGARDTTNTTDTVLPATDVVEYLFATRRMTDGAMLAWKTVVLRSALTASICSPSGSGGAGGPPGRRDGGPMVPPGSGA